MEAAIAALNPFGRVALCGAISSYNAIKLPPGLRNLALAGRRQAADAAGLHRHLVRTPAGAVRDRDDGWLRSGKVHYDHTVVDGLEAAVEAFLGMLRGENTGKVLVRTAAPAPAR